MTQRRREDLVTVKTYTIAVYAHTDRVHLEQEGIPAFVVDDNIVSAEYFWGNALGYIKLQVPRSQAQAARELLNRHSTEHYAFSSDPVTEAAPPCLACGESMCETEDRCPKCGWSFIDGAELDEPA